MITRFLLLETFKPATMTELENPAPKIFPKKERTTTTTLTESGEVNAMNVYDWVKDINDPEHPLTLEQLNIVEEENITIDNTRRHVHICFTPTIPHCSMSTLIGLTIRTRLDRMLPPRWKSTVSFIYIFLVGRTQNASHWHVFRCA